MPRPQAIVKRTRQLNIALTESELATVRGHADALGLRPVDFVRDAALKEQPTAAAASPFASVDRLVFEQLKRAGNNLNQIARQLNAFGSFVPVELDAALREVRALILQVAGHGA